MLVQKKYITSTSANVAKVFGERSFSNCLPSSRKLWTTEINLLLRGTQIWFYEPAVSQLFFFTNLIFCSVHVI